MHVPLLKGCLLLIRQHRTGTDRQHDAGRQVRKARFDHPYTLLLAIPIKGEASAEARGV